MNSPNLKSRSSADGIGVTPAAQVALGAQSLIDPLPGTDESLSLGARVQLGLECRTGVAWLDYAGSVISAFLTLAPLLQGGASIDVLPAPARIEVRHPSLAFADAPRVVTSEESVAPLAECVAAFLGRLLEREVAVGPLPALAGDVVLTLGDVASSFPGDEAMSLDVRRGRVILSGRSPAGVARAAARMLQLCVRGVEDGAWSFPGVRIDDAPTYPVRGIVVPEEWSYTLQVIKAINLAFLGSMNVVIVEGDQLNRSFMHSAWESDAVSLRRFARTRGIELLFVGLDELPFRRSEADPGAYLYEGGEDWIDATGPLLLASAERRFTDVDRARAFAWRPSRRTGDPASEERKALARLRGVLVRMVWKGRGSGFVVPPTLPFVVPRAWGGLEESETVEDFAPRAEAFVERAVLLLP
ncbi:MAG: glycoside hydrolase family 20 zincin-like fold domain-containing protein [Planctomycetota bacterium]